MKTIRFLLEKEFKQIFRNRSILALIMVMPIMQLIIMPLAADYEVKNINLAITDHDHSSLSMKLCNEIKASGYFKLHSYNDRYSDALDMLEKDKVDLILEIPAGFEKRLIRENRDQLYIAVNAINGVKANLGGAYLGSVIQQFNSKLRMTLNPSALSAGICSAIFSYSVRAGASSATNRACLTKLICPTPQKACMIWLACPLKRGFIFAKIRL